MDAEAFRHWGKRMVDIVADYWNTMRSREPQSAVQPGYMRSLIPPEAPDQPEDWEKILADIEPVVMSGTAHWHHPRFCAYFPTGNSYPAIMADILSDGIGCIGFSWQSSPACTELEMIMMDWLAKLLKLPDYFLFSHPSPGAGMIQSTASECTLLTLLAAKKNALSRQQPHSEKKVSVEDLVAYCSVQAHSSVEKAALLADVKIRKLDTDGSFSLKGSTLNSAILEDVSRGLEPFYHADSFNFNPHKALLINFDCSAIWFKDTRLLERSFSVNPVYLKHEFEGDVPDFRNWQIPLGRRFRSLKLWFVLRSVGVSGLQENIRKSHRLALQFAEHVRHDSRFTLVVPVTLGLVCFALKGSNEINQQLLKLINDGRMVYMVGATLRKKFIIRFVVCSLLCESEDVEYIWTIISDAATALLK